MTSMHEESTGWIDGEVQVQESLPSILDDSMLQWDPATSFPRKSRFISCLILLVVGTMSYLYRNTLLHRSNEHSVVDQIRKSIAEMEQIAATATKMETHAIRLADLTKEHLSPLTTKSESISSQTREKIHSEIDKIFTETINHMQSSMEIMVESTRLEILNMASYMSNQSARIHNASQNATTIETEAVHENPSNEGLIETTTSLPSIAEVASTVNAESLSVGNGKNRIQVDTTFWIFTIVGTTIITIGIAYYMQKRNSFHRDRRAFQDGFVLVRRIVSNCQNGFYHFLLQLRNMFKSIQDSISIRWYGDSYADEELSEDEISFLPRTPRSTIEKKLAADDIDESTLPRRHITFDGIDDSDYPDESDTEPFDIHDTNVPTMVRANEYGSYMTPEDFGRHEQPRRRSPRFL